MIFDRQSIKNTLAKFLLLLLLVFFVLIVLARANPLSSIPGRDGGFFLYAGSQILKGKLLYIDVWDSKGPGIFYVNALGLLLAKGSRWGGWFLEFLVAITSTLLGYKIAKTEWGHGAALLGAMIWLFSYNIFLDAGNFTEEYSLLFSFLAIFIFWKITKSTINHLAGWILLGSLLAINFLFRANNIGVVVSLMGAFVITTSLSKQYARMVKPILGFVAGIIIVFGLVAIYFLWLGTLKDMIQASVFYNTNYAGEHFNLTSTVEKAIRVLYPGIYIPLLGYLAIAWLFFKNKTITPLLLFALINWPVEMVLSSLSGRTYNHYYISWLPAIWLLSAFAYPAFAKKLLSSETTNMIEKVPWIIWIPILLLGSTNLLATNLDLYWNSFNRLTIKRSDGIEMRSPIANYVRENSKPEDTFLVWGSNAGLNYLARRDSPSAYIYYPLLVDSPYTKSISDQFYNDLTTKKPLYIADLYSWYPFEILSIDPVNRDEQIKVGKGWRYMPANVKDVFAFIEKNYILERKFGQVLIYKLKK